MKSNRRRVAAKVFFWISMVVLVVLLAEGFVFSTLQDWMPYELTFELPFEMKHDYIEMTLAVLVLTVLTSIFLAISARRWARKEVEMLTDCAECFGLDAADLASVDVSEEDVPEKKTFKQVKDEVMAKLNSEPVKRTVKMAAPIVGACVVGVALATILNERARSKRRREFYHWLG